jgi:3-hydroxyisobutyrate dehydrogenase
MSNIALLGLGIMGAGIASNLLKAGHNLAVYNRTAARAEPLAALGARVGATPADAAAGAEIVFSVVGDDAASRAVWLGVQGALGAMPPGAVVVECSTLSVAWIGELRHLAAARSLRFVDAPLGGSKGAAQAGTLTLFIGADLADLEYLRPVLTTFAENLIHFGAPGSGAAYKLINNMLGSIHLAALAEALALAERAGLDRDTVAGALTSGAASSPIVKSKLPRMLSHDYADPDFTLRWMHKDVSYALAAAEAHGLTLAMAAASRERYALAMERGLADADFAAVREVAGE